MGYGHTDTRDWLSSTTGINFNPITGKVESTASYTDTSGHAQFNGILGLEVNVRPIESGVAVSAGVVAIAIALLPESVPVIEGGTVIYAGCKLSQAC